MNSNTCFDVLSRVIGAIGEPGFAKVTAEAVMRLLDFELATLIVHRGQTAPVVVYENFAEAGGQRGIDNYIALTHRINPILRSVKSNSAVRARDFALDLQSLPEEMGEYIVPSKQEELGFRTVGWPPGLEEIGVYFEGAGGLVELSLFRARSRRISSMRQLEQLQDLNKPIAAAFEKHEALLRPNEMFTMGGSAGLTAREAQVAELLLAGCGSEVIARRLSISHYTVKDHRKRIFRKLAVGSLAELFALNSSRLQTGASTLPPHSFSH